MKYECEYKEFERAVKARFSQAATLNDIGETTGHHDRLKIGDACVSTDKRMDYPIFEVLDKFGEIFGYYIHVGTIDIDAFSEKRFDDGHE